jgi:hypothetical protein
VIEGTGPCGYSGCIDNVTEFRGIAMLSFVLWLVLLFLCWPLALLALVLYPLVWLVLLPFRLIGIGVDAVFQTLRAIVLLPARVLRGL